MSEKITTKLGTPVESLAHVTSLARDFLVTRRRVFRSTEGILRQDRPTRTALDQSGGLDNLLSNNQDPEAERSFLSSFSNLQQTLFVDRVTNSDLLKTPTLEEMYESSKNNGKIATKIKSALDECCKEIQEKIDQLSNLVKRRFKELFDFLDKIQKSVLEDLKENFDLIYKNFTILYDNLINFYKEEKHSFGLGLQSYRSELTDFLSTLYNLTRENINKLRDDVYATPDIVIVNVRSIVDMARDEIVLRVSMRVEQITASIDRILTLFLETIDAKIAFLIAENIAPILVSINSSIVAIAAALVEVNGFLGDIAIAVNNLPVKIETNIEKIAQKYKKEMYIYRY